MSEPIEVDNNYVSANCNQTQGLPIANIDFKQETRDRDASPRRDRPDVRDRSPPRNRDNYRERAGGFRDSRERQPPRPDRNYSNSVFVGNIPFDCTSNHLRELFKDVGSIARADIVTQNGRHKGMATVEFTSKAEVDKAIRDFDHTQFLEREIFVRQDNPPPQRNERFGGRDSYRNEGYGGGRDGGRDGYRDNYRDSYRDDGYGGGRGGYRDNYRDDRYGPSSRGGYGDERYGRDGGRDYYREERPPRREAASRTGPLYEIFVGNLPFRFRWQELKDLFKQVGTVIRADVRTDYDGRSKGYGTVSFERLEDVQNAVDKFNGTEIDGRRIDVREGRNNSTAQSSAPVEAQEPAQTQANTEFTEGVEPNGEKNDTIFVGNLPFATSNEDLFELFETVGRVSNAEIKFDANGRPGAAVVKFESEDSSEAALLQLNNYDYGGRKLSLSYAKRP
jgi:RNA recognition motif-containing protein